MMTLPRIEILLTIIHLIRKAWMDITETMWGMFCYLKGNE